MLGAARAVVLGAAGALPVAAPEIQLQGAWALDESSGTSFADSVAGNHATLIDPAGNATHLHAREAVKVGGSGSLLLSNQYLQIPMIPAYRLAAVSLVGYFQPWTFMRGRKHFQSTRPDLAGHETLLYIPGTADGALLIKRVERGLRGYVYQGGGRQWFGGSDSSVATLTEDAAYRVAVTLGATGAGLWVGDTRVAHLPAVTTGWTGVTQPIRIGRQDGTIRAPMTCAGCFVGDVGVWSGQLGASEIGALAAARTLHVRPSNASLPRPYAKPAALAGLPTFVIENQSGSSTTAKFQAAIDAANAAGGGWITQSNPSVPLTGIRDVSMRPQTHLYEVSIERSTSTGYWDVMVWWDTVHGTLGKMDGHGGASHYAIGCRFHSRHRSVPMLNSGNSSNRQLSTSDPDYGQPWPGTSSPDSIEAKRWHHEQARICQHRNKEAQRLRVLHQWNTYLETCSDALSCDENVYVTAENCRFIETRRGNIVTNGGNTRAEGWRCEGDSVYNGKTGPVIVSQGICDVEAFTYGLVNGRSVDIILRDYWGSNNLDAQVAGPEDYSGSAGGADFSNVHMVESYGLMWTLSASHNQRPCKYWNVRGSTIRVAKDFGGGSAHGSFLQGAIVGDNLVLLEDLLFVISGNIAAISGQYRQPSSGEIMALNLAESWYTGGPGTTRIVFRRCRWDVDNLPAGFSSSDIYCIYQRNNGPVKEIEFDDCKVASTISQDRPVRFTSSNIRVYFSNGGIVRDDGRANTSLLQGTYTLG